MAGTSIDCPHCGAKKSFFEFVVAVPVKGKANRWHALATCGSCQDAVLLQFTKVSTTHIDPVSAAKEGALETYYAQTRVLPDPPSPRVAEAIPRNVERPLLEAEQAYASGLFSAAGSCYRKSVERALKAIDPDLKGMLNQRIRSLEKSGLLPHDMIELLDQVRLFGNASMHEDDEDPTKEDCAAAREFCHLFLTYAFTLPAKVRDAKQPKEEVSA